MSAAVTARLRALLGAEHCDHTLDGVPRARPESAEGLALVLRTAGEAGWRVRVEGAGTWVPADAPCDLAVTTRALDRIVRVEPADLVATVEAGVPLDRLRPRLAEAGMWLALDPPGRPARTVGGALASAASGPLRLGFGPARDHVLGCTVATADGRLVTAGGTVVKNVAGYDLAKLVVGGFGAFGVLTQVHLRLRAVPPADATLVARGPRDDLTRAARDLDDERLDAQAVELLSPAAAAGEWRLAARLLGTRGGVEAEAARLAATGLAWERLDAERAAAFWHQVEAAPLAGRVTLRFGVLRDGLDDLLDLLADTLGEGIVTAGAASGLVRWSGDTTAEVVRALRAAVAPREIPVTLERAPWPVRHAAGHFGAYREGVGPVVGRLRAAFDPRATLSVALEAAHGG